MAPRIQIPVHWGQEVVGYASISPIDAHLRRYKWNITPGGHVYRTTRRSNGDGTSTNRRVYLHREIMGLDFGDPLVVDHVNGNPADNFRSNLEIVTQSENMRRAYQVQQNF